MNDKLELIALKHDEYAQFWRNQKEDPQNIATALYVMHLESAQIIRNVISGVLKGESK